MSLGGETGVMRGGGDLGDSSRRRRRRRGGRTAGGNEGIRENGRESSRRDGAGGGRTGGRRTTSLEELAWRKSAQYTDELRGELADLMSTEGSRRRARMNVHHQQQGMGAGRAGPSSSSVLLSSSAATAAQFAKPLQITSLDRVLRDSAQHGKHAAHLYSAVHVGAPSSCAETKRYKKRFADGSHMYLPGGAGGAGGAGGRGGRHLHGASHRESNTSGRWLAGQGATDRIHITTAFMHAHSLKQ